MTELTEVKMSEFEVAQRDGQNRFGVRLVIEIPTIDAQPFGPGITLEFSVGADPGQTWTQIERSMLDRAVDIIGRLRDVTADELQTGLAKYRKEEEAVLYSASDE